jgi:hypothetical protein
MAQCSECGETGKLGEIHKCKVHKISCPKCCSTAVDLVRVEHSTSSVREEYICAVCKTQFYENLKCPKCGKIMYQNELDCFQCKECSFATAINRPKVNQNIKFDQPMLQHYGFTVNNIDGTMTFTEFDKYQEDLLAQVVKMKDTKGKEYAHSVDRFANFNRLADRLSQPNVVIAWIYFMKHIDSIESYVREGKTFSTENIQGRIVDAITYLTLIGGMIEANKHE